MPEHQKCFLYYQNRYIKPWLILKPVVRRFYLV